METIIKGWPNSPKRYDTGSSELLFGLMFIGFALVQYLEKKGSLGLVFMFGVFIGAGGLVYLLNRALQANLVWPRTGYVALHQKKYWGTWTLIIALVTVVAAITFACVIGVRHVSPGNQETEIVTSSARNWIINTCGIAFLFACLASYAFWYYLIGKREHPWKWLALLTMVIGLLAIGLSMYGDLSKVLGPGMLFSGAVWLVSGTATLFSYLRHNKPVASRIL